MMLVLLEYIDHKLIFHIFINTNTSYNAGILYLMLFATYYA